MKFCLRNISFLFLLTSSIAIASSSYDIVELNQADSPSKIQARRLSGISIESINEAKFLQKKFGTIVKPTPLYTNKNINQFAQKLIGHEIVIYLKDETVNPTGSFKDRMPIKLYKRVSTYNEKNGLKFIAVSTGNHGRAVAYAANTANDYIAKSNMKNKFSVSSEITMSSNALPHKKKAIAQLGAKIRDQYEGRPIPSYDAAESLVVKEASADPAHTVLLMHADKDAINGYAVIAEEIIQQANATGVSLASLKPGEGMLLVPLGSGGLLSGVEEISAQYPNVYSIGVTAAPADMTYRSLKTNEMIRSAEPYNGELIVDGVMATPETFSLKRIRELAKQVVLVTQEDAVYATALLRKNGINVEPTSGLPLAAVLLGANKDYKNVRYAFVVLTGRNSSHEMDQKISALAKQNNQVFFNYFQHRRQT